jgi:hypothetical protein
MALRAWCGAGALDEALFPLIMPAIHDPAVHTQRQRTWEKVSGWAGLKKGGAGRT